MKNKKEKKEKKKKNDPSRRKAAHKQEWKTKCKADGTVSNVTETKCTA